MAEPIRIRIRYSGHAEDAMATPLGPAEGGGEWFRVHKPSFHIANVVRDDVIRLVREDDGTWQWPLQNAREQGAWRSMYAPIPEGVRGTPAYEAFQRFVAEQGVIVEGESLTVEYPKLVLSLPAHVPDAPIAQAYDHMLTATIGLTHAMWQQRVVEEQRARGRAASRRERARRLRRDVAELARAAGTLVLTVAALAFAAWSAHRFFTADILARPRLAAMAMAGLLLPVWVSALRERKDFALLWLPATGTALVALGLAHGTPATTSYAPAVIVGTLHAVVAGGFGIVLAIFSLFASDTRRFARVAFGVTLPAVLSGVAGVLFALTALGAASELAGFASTVRTIAIGITALLLVAPAAVLAHYVGAILGGAGWRSAPHLQRGALLSLPRQMVPALLRVAVPIAVVWTLALLVQLVAR